MELSEIRDELECTICLDLSASPIYTCKNGHVICGICFDKKIEKCPSCQASPLEICPFAERLSRKHEMKLKCHNYESGCIQEIPAVSLREHLKSECYYRDILCSQWKIESCNPPVSVPFKDFVQHLMEKHQYSKHVNTTSYWFLSFNRDQYGARWPFLIVEKNELNFILHSWRNMEGAFFWVTVLGDKTTARDYFYKLTLRKKEDENNGMRQCTWTLPVLPYHDHVEYDETVAAKYYVTFPNSSFLQFCTKVKKLPKDYTDEFEVMYEVIKGVP